MQASRGVLQTVVEMQAPNQNPKAGGIRRSAASGSTASTLDRPEPSSRSPLDSVAVSIAPLVLGWLIIVQMFALLSIGNGLSPTADPYGEADLVRSAQHYADYGFFVDAGLPHIVYGKRFPYEGWVTDLKQFPLKAGVYTRYPPLPNWIGGLLEITVGYQRLWMWRLVPVCCTLLALIYAFLTLRAPLGSMAAAVMLTLMAIVPMTSSHMHALHFEGYALALLVAQLALVTRFFFYEEKLSWRTLAAVGSIAFLQGCLSFDHVFVVAGAAIPLCLLARAHGHRASNRSLFLIVAASSVAFALAHLLHFWQVVHFYGSIDGALHDFSTRARFRFSGDSDAPYLTNVVGALISYGRLFWLTPYNSHFGPLLVLLSAAALIWRADWLPRTSHPIPVTVASRETVGKNSAGPAVAASYSIAALWLCVMPAHSIAHMHVMPRLFFLAYFVAALAVALRVVEPLRESTAD